MIKLNKNIKIDGLLFIRGKSGASVPILKIFFQIEDTLWPIDSIMTTGDKLINKGEIVKTHNLCDIKYLHSGCQCPNALLCSRGDLIAIFCPLI